MGDQVTVCRYHTGSASEWGYVAILSNPTPLPWRDSSTPVTGCPTHTHTRMHTDTHTSVNTHTGIHTHTHTDIQTTKHTDMNTHTRTYRGTNTHTHIYIYIYLHTNTHTQIRKHTHIYIYIQMHKHTHTHSLPRSEIHSHTADARACMQTYKCKHTNLQRKSPRRTKLVSVALQQSGDFCLAVAGHNKRG